MKETGVLMGNESEFGLGFSVEDRLTRDTNNRIMRVMRPHNLHNQFSERIIALFTWTGRFLLFVRGFRLHTIIQELMCPHKACFRTLVGLKVCRLHC